MDVIEEICCYVDLIELNGNQVGLFLQLFSIVEELVSYPLYSYKFDHFLGNSLLVFCRNGIIPVN